MHEVLTVQEIGRAGTKDGELLSVAETEFEAFVTVDRNLQFQQNTKKVRIPVFVLCARSNRLEPSYCFRVAIISGFGKEAALW